MYYEIQSEIGMINFLFSLFSKDYCPTTIVGSSIIREYILPYENIHYDFEVKGNFYIRRITYTRRYKNPLLGEFKISSYTGLLHVIIVDEDNWKTEQQHVLIPNHFNSDYEFLQDAYKRYPL